MTPQFARRFALRNYSRTKFSGFLEQNLSTGKENQILFGSFSRTTDGKSIKRSEPIPGSIMSPKEFRT